MFEKIKEFFKTKYRIVPVYQDNKRSGYQVQRRFFWGCWIVMQKPNVKKVQYETEVVTNDEAFFSSEEEAIHFVKCQKTMV